MRKESKGCLKLLAASIMAARQQAIEIYIIVLYSFNGEGKRSVNSPIFCAGVISCPKIFAHNPKMYNAGSKKTMAKIAVTFLGTLWVDDILKLFTLNVINFY